MPRRNLALKIVDHAVLVGVTCAGLAALCVVSVTTRLTGRTARPR